MKLCSTDDHAEIWYTQSMKKGPIILISTLIATLVFIVGVQYGKQVEVTDEAIKELLKRVPSPTVTSAPVPDAHSYKSLTSKTCGFSFVYPASYKITVISTYSAKLQENTKDVIVFSCDPELDLGFPEKIKFSSTSAELAGATATLYSSDVEKWMEFHTNHPTRKAAFSIGFMPDVHLLVEKSFQFIQ